MPGVAAVLLDQVAEQSAQAGVVSVGSSNVDELVEATGGQGGREPSAGPRDRAVPQGVERLGAVVGGGDELPVVRPVPAGRVPGGAHRLGAILLLHGTRRWQAGVQAQVDYLTRFDTPYPRGAAWVGITFEVVGGVFLILGALTPLIGAAVVAQQVLTICWTNYYRGPDLLGLDGSYHGGFEYNVALAALGLLFVAFGGGVVSLDPVFRCHQPTEEQAYESNASAEHVRA